MSGHSHWAKIKRSKAGNDAKRGREWSKLAKRIIMAAKAGGGKAEENLTLRYAIDEAKAANMPNDTIDRAIKKGTGELGPINYEKIMYEGYGPAGVAYLVETLTDNRHRTAPEIRNIFERAGGQLGSTGCVSWMFEAKGTFVISADKATEDALMEIALDAGGEDVRNEGDVFTVTCQVPQFAILRAALAAKKVETISAEIAMLPKSTITVAADKAPQVLHLLEALEENEDVQNVFANFDIPESVMAELGK